jgi:shikimate dehydrogenase
VTRPYAQVIGDPIAHSKSPLIHNFWLAKLGIDAEYRACHVRPEELEGYFAQRRKDAAWRGCNVTMPHKEAVIPFLDLVADRAARLNAVNTVARDSSGQLQGTNTDIEGVAEPLSKRKHSDYPNHVATYVQIIGAGGAARAAAMGAALAGYGDFDVFNRTTAKADRLAEMIGAPRGKGRSLEELGPIRNPEDGPGDQRYSHVVINASSMGMDGSTPVPIDLAHYYPDTIVFDLVYSPLETPLLKQARELGLRTIDGLEMLVAQAAAAFELFFGQPAPREHDAELRALLTSQ